MNLGYWFRILSSLLNLLTLGGKSFLIFLIPRPKLPRQSRAAVGSEHASARWQHRNTKFWGDTSAVCGCRQDSHGAQPGLPSGLWALLTNYSLLSFLVQGCSMVGPHIMSQRKGGGGRGEKAGQIILLVGISSLLGVAPEGWQSSRLDKSPDLSWKSHSQNLFFSFVKWDDASLLTVTSAKAPR